MRIEPGEKPRLLFAVVDANGDPVVDLDYTDLSSAGWRTTTAGVRSATTAIAALTGSTATAAHSTGSVGSWRAEDGLYFLDAPVGAADANADTSEAVIVLSDGDLTAWPVVHVIDAKVSSRNAVAPLSAEETEAACGEAFDASSIAGEVLDGLGGVEIQRISPFDVVSGSFDLIQGDDYVAANGTHTDFDLVDSDVDLENCTATVSARSTPSGCSRFDGVATIIGAATESPELRVEWPNAGDGANAGAFIWQARVVDNANNRKTEFAGSLSLSRSTEA